MAICTFKELPHGSHFIRMKEADYSETASVYFKPYHDPTNHKSPESVGYKFRLFIPGHTLRNMGKEIIDPNERVVCVR